MKIKAVITLSKSMMKSKFKLKKTGEELTMKNIHVIPHCHGLTSSNPTKLFEKG